MTVTLLPAATTQAQITPAASLASTLKAAHWRQRVLLICAPTATDAQLLKQRALLQTARAGLTERNLLVRELPWASLPEADRNYLRQLGGSPDSFRVLLIGKDGGVKRRDTEPVTPAALFATIDGMPMRRQEMKRVK
ncbi:DUF4174 domain-containing protein [Hymenobacter lapidiphilus]|uniref:DUF4174 domain-containing protein n=1 Tax=Hymenobacter lapidiphilus TaxID=2608003 RepID=A0A7Y7PLG2_9BACT|nr:DUF4174 domain-containing protein [Hymenobacter lapidiphilus]NVO29930.1 DUF4174 domain-containing protein [Hymenobacter lapidiphilus]